MTETKSQSHLDNNTILICRPGNRIVWYISDVVVPWVQYWVFFFQWLCRFRSADVCIRRMMGLNSCSHRAEKRTVWKEIWEPDAADEKLVQFKICEPFRRSPRSFSSSETLRGIAYQKDSQRGGKGGGSSTPPTPLPTPSPVTLPLCSFLHSFNFFFSDQNSQLWNRHRNVAPSSQPCRPWGDFHVSLTEEGQKGCQETCAMSLTLVWMSWRQSGHVSNCKAHSIHIPLEWKRQKKIKKKILHLDEELDHIKLF